MSLFNMLIIAIIFISLLLYIVVRFILNEQQLYKLKYTFYFCVVMLTAIVLQPFLIFRARNPSNLSLIARLLNPFFRILGIRYRLKNFEFLDKEDACVIVANHQSSIDCIGMMHLWPEHIRYCTVLAKKELIWAGAFGISSWFAGLEFIDRKNREKSDKTMRQVVNKIRNKSLRLWIFPEGTRNMNETFLPFKLGAFRSAIEAQVPIVPVVFSSYKPIYQADKSKKTYYWRSGCVTVQCLEPIDTKGMTLENDLHRLAELTRQRMLDVYSTLQTTVDDNQKNK